MKPDVIDVLLKGYFVTENGDIISMKKWRGANIITLKPSLTVHGYYFVGLSNRGVKKLFFVHKLVAHKYLGKRPDGYTINHKDGIKTNNHYKNLEYVSFRENILHAKRLGLMKEPWNKGKKINWIPKATFKVGNIPWNKGLRKNHV